MATANEVAEHLGVSARWVKDLSEQGVLPKARGRSGRDLDECRHRYLNHLRAKVAGEKDEDDELDELKEEKVLLTRAQRQKLDLEYQREIGQLIPAPVLTFVLGKVAPDIAGIMDTIPLKVQRRHPDITPNQLTTLQTEIAKAMNLAAELGERVPEYLEEYERNTDNKRKNSG